MQRLFRHKIIHDIILLPEYDARLLYSVASLVSLNFMALLTVSEESALTVAELKSRVFQKFARHFGLCACAFCVTEDSVSAG